MSDNVIMENDNNIFEYTTTEVSIINIRQDQNSGEHILTIKEGERITFLRLSNSREKERSKIANFAMKWGSLTIAIAGLIIRGFSNTELNIYVDFILLLAIILGFTIFLILILINKLS